jgi:hypothetical protein
MKLKLLYLSALATTAILAEEPKPAATTAPATTTASPTPAASAERLLFDGKTLTDWLAVDVGGSGQVLVEDEAIVMSQGENLTGLVYQKLKELPVTDYQITLEAKRTQGLDFFCGLTFPVGSHESSVTLVLGGWGGGVVGISSIDNLDASENSTTTYQRFEDDRWYRLRVQVTATHIKAWLDDKEVIDLETTGKKLHLRPGPIESFPGLSLTAYNTEAHLRNIKLSPLK